MHLACGIRRIARIIFHPVSVNMVYLVCVRICRIMQQLHK